MPMLTQPWIGSTTMRSACRWVLTGKVAVTEFAVTAVTVADPIPAVPGTGLQLMKLASQIPAQTCPLAVTVTRFVLLLVYVTSAMTVAPAEFCGVAVMLAICPVFMESEVGLRRSVVTPLTVVLEPLQPGRILRIKTANKAAKTRAAEKRRMHPPRRVGSDGCIKTKNAIPARISQ